MSRASNIRVKGFKKHYNEWRTGHTTAIPYEKLMHYINNGDEFGRKVPVEVLAELCCTSKNTMLKWLSIIENQNNNV